MAHDHREDCPPGTAPSAGAGGVKLPEDLPYEALRDIVARLQGAMYLELDAAGRKYWDPGKAQPDTELRRDLQEILRDYGLAPDRVQDARPGSGAGDLLAWAQSLGLSPEALDEELHNQADSIVAAVNNQGPAAQIEFLVEQLGVAETRRLLEGLASENGGRR